MFYKKTDHPKGSKKLIGAEINNSSISAIVDDLSKRNGDKYYGN